MSTLTGNWTLAYSLFSDPGTIYSGTFSITQDSPLVGSCTINGVTMDMSSGGVMPTIAGTTLWFTCSDTLGNAYDFIGWGNPTDGNLKGGATIPLNFKGNGKGNGSGAGDPGEMANWDATHQG